MPLHYDVMLSLHPLPGRYTMFTYTYMHKTLLAHAYTLGAIVSMLGYLGLASEAPNYRVLADSPEYVIAAALARMQVGE